MHMKIKKILPLLTALTLAACGGGGGGASVNYSAILGLALDNATTPTKLYVANADNQTLKTLDLSSLSVATVAGGANASGTANGTGTAARFNEPFAITRASSTDFYVADTGNHGIRKLTSAGVVTTLAGTLGTFGSSDGTGTAATFNTPKDITNDGTNLYVTDTFNHTVRQVVISTGAVTTLAGYAGTASTAGPVDGTGSAARFNSPYGVAYAGGNLYVTDTGNNAIRKVSLAGVVTTLAGSATGSAGSADGTGSAGTFNAPAGVVSDGTYLYVADSANHTIRKVDMTTRVVTTLAGTAGVPGSGDGTGAAARFNTPIGLAIDSAGNLYVTDQRYTRIRKVVTSTGVVTTLAASF
jgi:NHL repeat